MYIKQVKIRYSRDPLLSRVPGLFDTEPWIGYDSSYLIDVTKKRGHFPGVCILQSSKFLFEHTDMHIHRLLTVQKNNLGTLMLAYKTRGTIDIT